METKFTEQESLAVISEMIEQARNNFQKGRGSSMVYYGWLIVALTIPNIILISIYDKAGVMMVFSYWIWFLIIPGTSIERFFNRKARREAMVKTHIDSLVNSTWQGYLYSILTLIVVLSVCGLERRFYEALFLIIPIVLILLGLVEYIMAKAYRFKSYTYGAFIMWLGTVACVIAVVTGIEDSTIIMIQFFVLAICMISGFVIPGYKLNKLAKNS